MQRDDGASLLYPGKLHAVQGEPEAGKGWFAHLAAYQLMKEGKHVLYIDYEDDATTAVERQLALGTTKKRLLTHLHYVQPYEAIAEGWDDFAELLSRFDMELAVIDGLTEAFSVEGLDSEKNQDVAKWLQ